MEQLAGYIATGIVSLIVGLLLQRMKSRPKLLYWVPGSFLFELKDPQIVLRTDSLTIQNDGREPATSVEIVHKYKPDHFQFSTPIAFSEETTPNGEHVIKIPSLGAKEYLNMQLLSHKQQPVLLNVRSAAGPGQLIQVHLQRLWPKWVQLLSAGLVLIGLGFFLYWLILSVIYLSTAIGIIK